jgi:TfoX/Sxy family transcriptional regulator of competence genes
MAVDDDLVESMRAVLAGAGAVREVRMFGGLCFMLDGNMGAGTSKRSLLVCVARTASPMYWRGPAQSRWRWVNG